MLCIARALSLNQNAYGLPFVFFVALFSNFILQGDKPHYTLSFVVSSTMSAIFAAAVPLRTEYTNVKAASKRTFRTRKAYLQNPVRFAGKADNNVRCNCNPGTALRILFTRDRYSDLVYLRFIRSKTFVLPDCTGKWIWRQICGCFAMVSDQLVREVFGVRGHKTDTRYFGLRTDLVQEL